MVHSGDRTAVGLGKILHFDQSNPPDKIAREALRVPSRPLY
jgi:hypothetical protein